MAYDLDEEIIKKAAEALRHKEKLEIHNQKQRKRKFQKDYDVKYKGVEIEADVSAEDGQDPNQLENIRKPAEQPKIAERPGHQDESVILPSVIGMPYERAANALLATGLDVFPYFIEGNSAVPIVVGSQPGPGSEVVAGQTITLTVARSNQSDEDEEDREEEKPEEEDEEEEPEEENEEEPEEEESQRQGPSQKGGRSAEAAPKTGAGGGAGAGTATTAGGGAAAAGGTATAATAAESAGVVAFLGATWEFWVPALLILVLLGAMIAFVIFAPIAVCNTGGLKGWGIYIARKTSQVTGNGDFCKGLIIDSGDLNVSTDLTNTDNNRSTEEENRYLLAQYGITVNNPAPTTQVGGMQLSSLYEIIDLAQSCDAWARKPGDSGPPGNRCGILVTGGTEPGHSTGTCSHATGYKFDLRITTLLNQYITQTNAFRPNGRRGNDPVFIRQIGGAEYVLENDHWDVKVGC